MKFPGTTTKPTAQAVFSKLDITGYNGNILPTYQEDDDQLHDDQLEKVAA